jgi:hypothetical protein
MKWSTIFGVFLLLVSLVLAILFSAKVPLVKTTELFKESPIEVEPGGLPANFYNATLEPLGKEGYQVGVSVFPYNVSINVDLWVVNESSVFRLGLLTESLAMGALNQTDYPDKPPFSDIEAYAKKIGVTGGYGNLVNLDHNGTYCFMLVSFLTDRSQYVSVSIEEQYIESYYTWLKPSPVTTTVTVAIFIGGVGLIVVGLKRSVRGARRRRKRV